LIHGSRLRDSSRFSPEQPSQAEVSSEEDQVEDLLSLTEDHKDALEVWMREVVVPDYQRFLADPSIGIPFEEVEAELDRDMEEILKGR
jgi:hypothetical protein